MVVEAMFNNNLSIAAIETETIRLKQSKEKRSHQEFLRFYDDGIICLNRGDYRHAISNFEEALKIDSTNRAAQRFLIEAITADMTRDRRPKGPTPPQPMGNMNGGSPPVKRTPRPSKRFVDKQGRHAPVIVRKAFKIPLTKPEVSQEA